MRNEHMQKGFLRVSGAGVTGNRGAVPEGGTKIARDREDRERRTVRRARSAVTPIGPAMVGSRLRPRPGACAGPKYPDHAPNKKLHIIKYGIENTQKSAKHPALINSFCGIYHDKHCKIFATTQYIYKRQIIAAALKGMSHVLQEIFRHTQYARQRQPRQEIHGRTGRGPADCKNRQDARGRRSCTQAVAPGMQRDCVVFP